GPRPGQRRLVCDPSGPPECPLQSHSACCNLSIGGLTHDIPLCPEMSTREEEVERAVPPKAFGANMRALLLGAAARSR
ncbi:MAG: hypothetical protein NTX16_00160, partial [Actinobacteria bacterium]|nr:hypothetical protein [Actinomycetota bacterium]